MTTQRISCLLIAVAGLVLAIANEDFRFDAATLKDKSSWTQVNAKPYRLSVDIDALCGAPTARAYEPYRKKNPHAASSITVYVNNIGREAMFAKDVQRFPEGSIIVKQKISTPFEGSKPLLYTIMRKREPGYNSTVGDWEFSVVGADGTKLEATGKLEKCQACHIGKSDSDFVFRPYLKSE